MKANLNFQQQSSVSHDASEIIIICRSISYYYLYIFETTKLFDDQRI